MAGLFCGIARRAGVYSEIGKNFPQQPRATNSSDFANFLLYKIFGLMREKC